MSIKLTLSLVLAVVVAAHAGSYLDIFDLLDGKKLIEVPDARDGQPNRNCMCKGPACICCVNFNMTLIELTGPGCIHVKYSSPEEGLITKVSYGKKITQSTKIQGTSPAPLCIELFGKLAQVCSKINDLAPTEDGLRGCVKLEPKIFGAEQIEFPIGCFKSTNGVMEVEDPPVVEETPEEEEEDDSESESEILHNIYQTAEKGLAFFKNFFELNDNNTTSATPTPKPQETSRRFAKNLKHPNQL
ncbi:hypothetical protein O3G_MSEX004897 [Manduca sexta]|uniref:DUF4773 domain-containing protein n=1 Tax=Manduca sexta TaxID=7130 RepID=A0A921YXW8_MANSE|nr:hypothetical protein O3G_MSEX004897 [Manduca sexta]